MDYQFCGVFLLKKKLYMVREEGVGGPRRMVMPLKELPVDIDPNDLAEEVFAALDDYREEARPVTVDELETLNDDLLGFFGERSVAAFERKKKDVTVRRGVKSAEIRLFEANGRELPSELGLKIKSEVNVQS